MLLASATIYTAFRCKQFIWQRIVSKNNREKECLAAVEIKSTLYPPPPKGQQCHKITRTSATSAVAVVAESINASV